MFYRQGEREVVRVMHNTVYIDQFDALRPSSISRLARQELYVLVPCRQTFRRYFTRNAAYLCLHTLKVVSVSGKGLLGVMQVPRRARMHWTVLPNAVSLAVTQMSRRQQICHMFDACQSSPRDVRLCRAHLWNPSAPSGSRSPLVCPGFLRMAAVAAEPRRAHGGLTC